MNRLPFYEVRPEAYLFRDKISSSDARSNPEERIRQWCAFELLSAYGIRINDLEFERPVRVGSKIYRIDILVLQHGAPWAVVECKEPDFTKHADAMEQAKSYARAEDVRASWVIYTNGSIWQVQKRIHDRWVPVPDLPRTAAFDASMPLDQLLRTHKAIAPILFKLGDDQLERRDAQRFLKALQVFFNGMSLLTVGSDRDLLIATDNLLRVLVEVDHDPNYRMGKLGVAAQRYETFRKRAGYDTEIHPPTGTADISEELQYLHVGLMSLLEGAGSPTEPDACLIRLNTALLEYGRSQGRSRPSYPLLGSKLHDALRTYLNCCMAINLNAHLPDPLDHIPSQDVRDYCRLAWDHFADQA